MNRPERKMPISERAKQFMPFAALKGLPEALREKERITVPRRELTEDMAQELNCQLSKLRKGMTARIEFYSEYEYVKITGTVSRIDENMRIIRLGDTEISLDDITCIELL